MSAGWETRGKLLVAGVVAFVVATTAGVGCYCCQRTEDAQLDEARHLVTYANEQDLVDETMDEARTVLDGDESGKGVISVLSNVAPRQTHEICSRYFEGDVEGSAALQLKAVPLVEALFSEVNPIPVKKGLELMGMCGGRLRMPLTEMEPAHAAKLEEEMKKRKDWKR